MWARVTKDCVGRGRRGTKGLIGLVSRPDAWVVTRNKDGELGVCVLSMKLRVSLRVAEMTRWLGEAFLSAVGSEEEI